jgi:flagellar protein FlaG
MFPANAPKLNISQTEEYRESYANSVQVRMSLWDFFLMFGTVTQNVPDTVDIKNFQGVYLSPQQAKALVNLLNQNLAQYEATFGEIRLDATGGPGGAVQ